MGQTTAGIPPGCLLPLNFSPASADGLLVTAVRKKRYALVLVILTGGAMITKMGWDELRTSQRLSNEGITVSGNVVNHSRLHRTKGGDQYWVTVRFQPVEGASLIRVLDVPRFIYTPAVKAGTVPIRYLPNDPTICVAGETVRLRFGQFLFGLSCMVGGLYLIWFFRFAQVQVRNLCVPVHEFTTVDAHQYKVDHTYYEQGRTFLSSRGFRFLADCEDLTFRQQNGLRIPIRTMVSEDGATSAGLYHFRPRWIWRLLGAREFKVLDLETQFTDGRWLVTTNAALAGALLSPPAVNSLHLPAQTPFATIVDTHIRNLVTFLTVNPGVQPVRLTTLDDVHRAQADLQRIKAEHREVTGLTKEELERIGGATPSVATAILHDGIQAGHESNKRAA